LTRYNPDRNSFFHQVRVLGDGRFYVTGIEPSSDIQTYLLVARYNPDGTLDKTFGGNDHDGAVLRLADDHVSSGLLEVAPDGRVVLGSDSHDDLSRPNRVWNIRLLQGEPAIRLNARGSLLIEGRTDADEISVSLRSRDGRLV